MAGTGSVESVGSEDASGIASVSDEDAGVYKIKGSGAAR
jgi:hypothetical protein